jgi:hypothetical protein
MKSSRKAIAASGVFFLYPVYAGAIPEIDGANPLLDELQRLLVQEEEGN